MQIKLMYKIHCVSVAQGMHRSAGNNTFYEELEGPDGALEAARQYVSKPYNEGQGYDMVIYKAHVLVRRERPPIEVLSINRDGEVVPMR